MFEAINTISAARQLRPVTDAGAARRMFPVDDSGRGGVEPAEVAASGEHDDRIEISDRAVLLYEAQNRFDDTAKTKRSSGKGVDKGADSSAGSEGALARGEREEGRTTGAEQTAEVKGAGDDKSDEAKSAEPKKTGTDGAELTEIEIAEVKDMKKRDREVRAHEQAHKAVAGSYGGAIRYDYETGPDNNRYAVGGHVPIDMSEVPNSPERTAQKMEVIQRAAMAPGDPSAADRSVASRAAQIGNKAKVEVAKLRYEKAEAAKAQLEPSEEANTDTTLGTNTEDTGPKKSTEAGTEAVSQSSPATSEPKRAEPAPSTAPTAGPTRLETTGSSYDETYARMPANFYA